MDSNHPHLPPPREVLERKKRILAKLMQVEDSSTLSLVERLLDGSDPASAHSSELVYEILRSLRGSDSPN